MSAGVVVLHETVDMLSYHFLSLLVALTVAVGSCVAYLVDGICGFVWS